MKKKESVYRSISHNSGPGGGQAFIHNFLIGGGGVVGHSRGGVFVYPPNGGIW